VTQMVLFRWRAVKQPGIRIPHLCAGGAVSGKTEANEQGHTGGGQGGHGRGCGQTGCAGQVIADEVTGVGNETAMKNDMPNKSSTTICEMTKSFIRSSNLFACHQHSNTATEPTTPTIATANGRIARLAECEPEFVLDVSHSNFQQEELEHWQLLIAKATVDGAILHSKSLKNVRRIWLLPGAGQ